MAIEANELNAVAVELGALLKQQGSLLTLAESCTGGLLAAAITSIPGSSAWFDCGFVTYSNTSKQRMLGVSLETIASYGAVSEETAAEMAQGALNKSQAHYACSITGIAGPDGGTKLKPVGTVCFAWTGEKLHAYAMTKKFSGDREQVRYQAAITALNELLKLIKAD